MSNSFFVDEFCEGMRVDSYLSEQLENTTRNYVQNLIDGGFVSVNGKACKASKKIKLHDVVEVTERKNIPTDIIPENIPIEIVYQDEYFAVINKKQGMIVHPANLIWTGTLVNALLYHLDNLSGINGVIRPGIVHRIDKDTSGLLVVAKNDFAHNSLAEQIKTKTCRRIYLALTEGVIPTESGIVDKPIGRSENDRKKMAIRPDGRPSCTHYKVLERFNENTYIECELETGRTHQIRVHMKSIGFPIVGDATYGIKKQKFNLDGQLLHAHKLILHHPKTGKVMTFEAPLPDYFEKVLKILRSKKNN